MGAVNQYEGFNGKLTTVELTKAYAKRQEELRHEYGNNPYAGHLGIKTGLVIRNLEPFETEREACVWIDNASGKWDPAVAVKCKNRKGELIWLVGGLCPS